MDMQESKKDKQIAIIEVVRHPHFEVPYPQLKRGQQTLGALVAVVRSNRYINVL